MSAARYDPLSASLAISNDLQVLRLHYPRILSEGGLHAIADAFAQLLVMDAADCVGVLIADVLRDNAVIEELVYRVRRDDVPDDIDTAPYLPRPDIPSTTKLTPWVIWRQSFLDLPETSRVEALDGTGWATPGTEPIHEVTYGSGTVVIDRTLGIPVSAESWAAYAADATRDRMIDEQGDDSAQPR